MWTSAKPNEAKWDDKTLYAFLRELHARPKFGSFTWNPPNVPAGSTVDVTLTTTDAPIVEGLRAGQPVTVTPPSTIDAGIMGWGRVDTDDTLTIRLANVTAGAINPVSGTWSFEGTVL